MWDRCRFTCWPPANHPTLQVSATLALLPGGLSFVSMVGLRTHVLWTGSLRASWGPAVARSAAFSPLMEIPNTVGKL